MVLEEAVVLFADCPSLDRVLFKLTIIPTLTPSFFKIFFKYYPSTPTSPKFHSVFPTECLCEIHVSPMHATSLFYLIHFDLLSGEAYEVLF